MLRELFFVPAKQRERYGWPSILGMAKWAACTSVRAPSVINIQMVLKVKQPAALYQTHTNRTK